MPTKQPDVEFHFVNSTVGDPAVPQDQAVRALIRKQAMKKASAARRKDGNYGKHNLRQYPVFIIKPQHDSSQGVLEVLNHGISPLGVEEVVFKQEGLTKLEQQNKTVRSKKDKKNAERERQRTKPNQIASLECFPVAFPISGYELASSKADFNLLDLSSLATLYVGRAARAALSDNGPHLIQQLHSFHKQWSYLSYLPSRYDHVPCLSAATDCVISRAKQVMNPYANREPAVIASYVRALDTLQRALDDPAERYRPEVLCATEILSLYELLDPMGEKAWIRHAAGAAKLIQMRGPERYTTEFEKALFLAHTGTIMTECVLNNERCFLEEEPWQNVFRSVIKEEEFLISDRSEAVVSLIALKSYVAGFCFDVTNIIHRDAQPDWKFINYVSENIRQYRRKLSTWHHKYMEILKLYPDMRPGSVHFDSHAKAFATYLTCMMISGRLLSAISRIEHPRLEQCTQDLADQMLKLDLQINSASEQTSIFVAINKGIADSIKKTHEDWNQFTDEESEVFDFTGNILARSKMENWCNAFGRKLPWLESSS